MKKEITFNQTIQIIFQNSVLSILVKSCSGSITLSESPIVKQIEFKLL